MKYIETLYIGLIILIASCDIKKPESIKHFRNSNKFYEREDYKNAYNEIRIAIQLDSSNLNFKILKGQILREIDNIDEALQIFETLKSKKYKMDTIFYEIGSCYYYKGHYYNEKEIDRAKANNFYEQAIENYDKAITLNINYYKAYRRKLNSLHQQQKNIEALIFIDKTLKLFPDSISLICERGVEKFCLKDFIGSKDDFNYIIKNCKKDSRTLSDAYRFRGQIESEKKNYKEAISDLSISINYDSKNPYTFVNRAECYLQSKDREKACLDYRKAIDLGLTAVMDEMVKNCNQN